MNAQTRHSSKYINQNYRIKVSGYTGINGEKIHTLIGVARLISILGAELTDKLIDKADNGMGDKAEFKFRRGLKVTLYAK